MDTTMTTIMTIDEEHELWDTADEQFYAEDSENINVVARRLNRQEQRRQKRSRDYADTLRVNAIRHAIEYNDGKRKRESTLLQNIRRYASGGFEVDMA